MPTLLQLLKFVYLVVGVLMLAATLACLIYKSIGLAVASGIVCAYALNGFFDLLRSEFEISTRRSDSTDAP